MACGVRAWQGRGHAVLCKVALPGTPIRCEKDSPRVVIAFDIVETVEGRAAASAGAFAPLGWGSVRRGCGLVVMWLSQNCQHKDGLQSVAHRRRGNCLLKDTREAKMMASSACAKLRVVPRISGLLRVNSGLVVVVVPSRRTWPSSVCTCHTHPASCCVLQD